MHKSNIATVHNNSSEISFVPFQIEYVTIRYDQYGSTVSSMLTASRSWPCDVTSLHENTIYHNHYLLSP